MINLSDLKPFLDEKADLYNRPNFIASDPIQIPHQFEKKEDIEIIAFIIATIAWGNRTSIIKNGEKLVKIMGNSPHEFILNYDSDKDFDFVHRTFNSQDLSFFFSSLHHIYQKGTLESTFKSDNQIPGILGRISSFRKEFLTTPHESRSEKHISNPLKNSSAKRLCMFLRWMVRDDNKGVDFGIWPSISKKELHLPLDVHTGNVARKLGLLKRTQNDWKAVAEIQEKLILMDPNDPCKYDFALFGLGAFEKF
jgi:uncharacterized protein (TIGR02757 family)